MTDPPIELSSAGEQRRESILAMAKAEARHRRRRRRTAQALTAVIVFALLVPSLLLHLHHHSPPVAVVPNIHSHIDRPVAATSSKSRIVVTRIETDPRIIERLAIPPQPPRWKKIGDDELLRDLASAHRPAGLAYVGDRRPVLLFRSSSSSTGG